MERNQNDCHPGIVLYLNDPSHFSFLRDEDQRDFNIISEKIGKIATKLTRIPHSQIRIRDLIIVKCEIKSKVFLQRARVHKVKAMGFYAHILDLGFYRDADEAFEMPQELRIHPPVAVECRLNKIMPINEEDWTREDCDYMMKMIVGSERCILQEEGVDGVVVNLRLL